MGKGRPRAVQKGGLRQSSGTSSPSNVPPAPVYYPSEEEFKDPLEYIYKIRPEAEPYGVCKIVPPQSWKPPFALDSDKFKFPTKTQAIHQLQARPAACDSKTFVLDYNRFLEERCGRKTKKRVVFEGADLDLCRLFNAVKRYGGYDKVVKYKKWGDVARFLRSSVKVSECAKHVLCQLYREHLFDYEGYYNRLNREKTKSCKRRIQRDLRIKDGVEHLSAKRRRRNNVAGVESCRMKEKEEEENDQICEQCNSGLHGEVMLLCDRCNKGWHIYCLSPPLEKVPPGNWYCLDCLNSNEDNFGFVPGKQFSMEDFRRIADRAKKKWFGSGSVSRVHVEKKFWEIVEGSLGEVEVMYGSDLDTSLYGSGFPRGSDERPDSVESNIWDEYCSSPWNLNNLPKLRGSMLHAVHQSIAGVMVPWLYVGMLFSSFCWHFEDHCFYSMNYLHWGEPKCWYSVPGSESDAFEKVMRKTLPDLFDAQPDLLFQLVTMLNPTVLQENGVPVYSVLQEPGNFVITFPRSFHGGFNFGFNCAEAVNFAPADWIPHGGYCADLYRLYRKPAVLSHEELLCVVAKGDYDSKVTSFLKKELLRIYSEEKGCREQLWKNGIIKSSPMPPRKCPESVGTEEDPTCIICQQYLYLSAVVCCCRPSAYVCLEHWKHICECKPSRRRLLYRHTLAELNNLILTVDRCNIVETQSSKVSWQASLFSESSALARKVKGSQATLAHLAEQWLLRSSSAVENPFSKDVYRKLLKEAEQFLWAGSDMDPVRIMEKKLVEAQSWAEGVRSCLHTIESCSAGSGSLEKANLDYVNELLTVDPLPCNEPRYLKLKEYAEEANKLASEIDSALLSCSKISELEDLYSRSCHLGIHVKGSQKLQQKVCSVKEWLNGLQMCLLEKRPGSIAIDSLYNLKSEVIGLNVLLPETELLLELLRKAETYRARCTEVLKDTMNLEKVGMILQELDRFTVTFPELELLRQYHTEAVSWMSRFDTIRMNIHERVDQDKVVKELNIILREAASLRIEVRELPLVELELKKACCRAKALQAKSEKMPLDFVRQLIIEAVRLQIDGEDLFVYIRGIVDAATLWEGSAVNILAREGQLTEFEEILRASDDIPVILPSLGNVISVITMAKSWLKNSEQFLQSAHSDTCSSSSLLEVGKLKEVVSESKLLKISLEEKSTLEILLKKCTRWEEEAFSLLQSAECLYNLRVIDDGRRDDVTLEIDDLLVSLDAMIKAGLSLGFDFCGTQKLRNAHSGLQWCNKVLHFSSVSPSVQEIESLMELEEQIRVSCACGALSDMLIDAVKWMKKVSVIVHVPSNCERYSFIDAEETLAECQLIPLSFPVMAEQLASKIQNHRLWQGKVHQYLSLETDHRLWSQLLQLKDMSEAATFNCPERDIVLSEVEKVENWRQRLQELIGISTGDSNSIIGAIIKIKGTLDRSLYVYDQSRGCRAQNLCMCCSNDLEFHDFLTCSICENCYHLPCLGPAFSDKSGCHMSVCSFCQFAESGSDCQISKNHLMQQGERPELNVLRKLCADVADLSVWMEERDPLQELLERALECKACLTEIIDSASAYAGEELSSVSRKLATALKAMAVAAVHDHQGSCSLEVALARHLWRVRARNLFQGFAKPTVLKIQNLLKEGLTVNVARNDYYMQKLMELKDIGLQWAKTARKVASDSGALALDKVFEVIVEGENLPVYCEKELTLLRSRSMLYCICRKPYDQRPMIACDQCDEWYHFDCIKLFSPPEFYICPACKPQKEEFSETERLDREISTSTRVMEPKTPSPQHRSSREKQQCESRMAKKPSLLKNENEVTCSSRIDQLWWRNRKPFRRTARKRAKLDALAFFNLQQ